MVKKQIRYWSVILYNPNDIKKDIEEREILLEKKFKTVKDAYEGITETLRKNNCDVKLSLITLRGMTTEIKDDSKTRSILHKIIKITKIKVEYIEKIEKIFPEDI